MAQHPTRPRSLRRDDTELWFSLPSSAAQQQEQGLGHEFSAHHATSNRWSTSSTASVSSQTIPSILTPQDLNKPLPPPPSGPEKMQRTATALRSFFRRQPSNPQDSSHLKPASHVQHQRHSFAEATLSVNTHDCHDTHAYSMPCSPFEHRQPRLSSDSEPLTRTHSANPMPLEPSYYQPYSVQPEYCSSQSMHSVAVHTFFESPPRARTFPDATSSSSTVRGRPLSHANFSPTDPFTDPSQFHLFAEATTGISENMDLFSSNGPPRPQSSLFTQTHSDRPVAFRSASASRTELSRDITDWQSFESQTFLSQYTHGLDPNISRPEHPQSQPNPHMNALNRELELLGLDDDTMLPDDELPDYAQSQAEHNAVRREEALARARELEARWRNSRS